MSRGEFFKGREKSGRRQRVISPIFFALAF
jgi:hypothetical protein